MTALNEAVLSPAGANHEAMAVGRHTVRITADQTGGSLGGPLPRLPPAKAHPSVS